MGIKVKPITILPDRISKAEDWVAFYDALVKRYGKKPAAIAFAKRWAKRGDKAVGGQADVVQVEKGTGLSLQKDSIEILRSSVSGGADLIGGFINTASMASKVMVIGSVVLIVSLGGVIVYKIYKATAEDTGKAVGIAAKVYSGKP